MKVPDTERVLTFAWERVRRVPFVLGAFLIISFLGHVGAFFLFRVVYPAQASMPMPPPPVTLLDPSRPDHQALLRWADAEDPRPGAGSAGITDRLLELMFQPSYAVSRTAPLTLPAEIGRIQYPPARDPLTLIRSVDAAPPPPAKLPASEPTRVTISGELGRRLPAPLPLKISASAAKAIEADAAEFLIGVTADGEVRYVVLQRSSGVEELDAEAAVQLRAARLERSDAPIAWGRATIQWGPEAFLAGTK